MAPLPYTAVDAGPPLIRKVKQVLVVIAAELNEASPEWDRVQFSTRVVIIGCLQAHLETLPVMAELNRLQTALADHDRENALSSVGLSLRCLDRDLTPSIAAGPSLN